MMIDSSAIDDREIVELPIKQIRRDGGCQSRDEIKNDLVIEYAEKYAEGHVFPPVDVFFDGKSYWLVDGFHRVLAALRAKIETVLCRVREGTRRDAVLFSVGANVTHGLRRSNNDKIRAVMRVLNDDEWCLWTDRRISEACGVSDKFVASLRPRSIQAGAHGKTRLSVRNGVEHSIDTTRRPKVAAVEVASPLAAVEVASAPSRDPLREFIKTLKADDVPYRLNVKTEVGMAMVVTDDAVYHVAAIFSPSSFLEAFGAVSFQRRALKLKRAVIVGPLSSELEPYIEHARTFGVAVKPSGG